MKFDSGNHAFISRNQVIYLRVKALPNKRKAKEYLEIYDNFFVKTTKFNLTNCSKPQTLIEVVEQSDLLSWIVTSLGEKLTTEEERLLKAKRYQSFLIYQPPFGEPWIAWSLDN